MTAHTDANERSDLLPCPFCGGRATYVDGQNTLDGEPFVCCDNDCRAEIEVEGEDCIAAWNTRAATAPAGDVVPASLPSAEEIARALYNAEYDLALLSLAQAPDRPDDDGYAAAHPAAFTPDEAAIRAAHERAALCADSWSKTQQLLMHAGELTAQELRTAVAVAKGIAAAIRALPEREG